MTEPSGARAARQEREQRHKAELNKAYRWKDIAIGTGLFAAVFFVATVLAILFPPCPKPPDPWRTDQAPALQPYYVVTQGYVTKKGEWKSFDNGESITVTHWTTNQP